MAAITVQAAVEAGVEPTLVAAAGGGDTALNPFGRTYLIFNNGDASPTTITITAQTTSKTIGGMGPLTKSNVATAVPAGERWIFGPFPKEAFNNSSGQLAITYSSVTSLTVAAIELPQSA